MRPFRMMVEVRERGAIGIFEWRAYWVQAEDLDRAIAAAAGVARVVDGMETRFVAPAHDVEVR